MHPFFAPLDAHDLGLLLTALTRGGSEQRQLFDFLPPSRRGPVDEKAEALLQIPGDKRVALMVRELRSLVGESGRHGVERVDPSWLAEALSRERPRVIAAILTSLPQQVVRSILRRLPARLRADLPSKESVAAAPAALTATLRRQFEAQFAPMPPSAAGPWGVVDIVHLERRDLAILVRDLGLVELGQAFAAVGRMALLDLCRRLPREHAEELVQAVKIASRVDTPDLQRAQRFLSRVVVNFDHTEEFLQKAGLWRLAKATLRVDPGALTALTQRLPKRAANLLTDFRERAIAMEEVDEAGGQRVADGILVRLVVLARAGRLEGALPEAGMRYHDPGAAAGGLDVAADEGSTGGRQPGLGDDGGADEDELA